MSKIAIHCHRGHPEQETVVNISFSLILNTAIVNKNESLFLVFPQHEYVIWLSKGMIQIMTYIYHFNASFHKRRSCGGRRAKR